MSRWGIVASRGRGSSLGSGNGRTVVPSGEGGRGVHGSRTIRMLATAAASTTPKAKKHVGGVETLLAEGPANPLGTVRPLCAATV